MDPIATCTSLLTILIDLYDRYETWKENKRSCKTLVLRLQVFVQPLRGIINAANAGPNHYDAKALAQMNDIIHEGHNLISKFSQHTYLRYADAIIQCSGWTERFAEVNRKITQACADLTLSVSVSQEEQRQQDLADFCTAMSDLMEQVMENTRQGNAASSAEMRLIKAEIQADIRANYKSMCDAMLRFNAYPPLTDGEEAGIALQRDGLVTFCQIKFEEMQESLAHIECGVDDIRGMVETLLRQQQQQQQPAPPPAPPPATPASEDEARRALLAAARTGEEAACRVVLTAWGHVARVVNAEDAADRQNAPLTICAEAGREALVVLLLAAPAIDINKTNPTGWSALLWSCKAGNAGVSRLLLANPSINPNLSNNNGYSPLLVAAAEGHKDIVAMLLGARGIDLFLKNKNGRTALDVARTSEIRALIASRMAVFSPQTQGQGGAIPSSSSPPRADALSSSPSSSAAATTAASSASSLRPGGPLLEPAEASRRAFLAAANRLKQPVAGRLFFPGTGQKLYSDAAKGDLASLTRRCDKWMGNAIMNWQSTSNGMKTPLIAACEAGHLDCARLLLTCPGVDPLQKDALGQSAQYWAQKNRHAEIASLLGNYCS